ncbi:hypothetical protein LRY29_00195 [Candidatus Saccharibacteria bacterium]|nr:hypothetical protein [Candidatus Saccharibacteria bacterium]
MNQRSNEYRQDPELLKEYGRLFGAASELAQRIEAVHPEQDSEHTFGFDMFLHEGVTVPEAVRETLGEVDTTSVTFFEDMGTGARSISIHLEGTEGTGVISRSNQTGCEAQDVVIDIDPENPRAIQTQSEDELAKRLQPINKVGNPELHKFLFGLIGLERRIEQQRQASASQELKEIDILKPEIFRTLRELYTNNSLFNQSALGYEFATSETTHFVYSSNEGGLEAFSVRFASRDGNETIIGRASMSGKLKLSFRKVEATTAMEEAIPITALYAPTPDDLRHLTSLIENETISLTPAMPEIDPEPSSEAIDPAEIVANGPLNDTIIAPMAEIALVDLVDGNRPDRDYKEFF